MNRTIQSSFCSDVAVSGGMNQQQKAIALVREVLRRHQLDHVRVEISRRARTRLGAAKFRNGKPHSLSLSSWLVENAPWELIEETILHEVAHLLAGADAGHGSRWKAIAKALGCSPRSCAARDVSKFAPEPKWRATCCGLRWERHRLSARLRKAACPRCWTAIEWEGASA